MKKEILKTVSVFFLFLLFFLSSVYVSSSLFSLNKEIKKLSVSIDELTESTKKIQKNFPNTEEINDYLKLAIITMDDSIKTIDEIKEFLKKLIKNTKKINKYVKSITSSTIKISEGSFNLSQKLNSLNSQNSLLFTQTQQFEERLKKIAENSSKMQEYTKGISEQLDRETIKGLIKAFLKKEKK
jgi:methyl-accepting chemotaxis protein